MKITRDLFLFFTALLFTACLSEAPVAEDSLVPEARGVMQIEITEQHGDVQEDRMQTIRFLVFKDVSGLPDLELNEFFDVTTLPGWEDASELQVILEVSRKVNGTNKKTVVAIVNEPQEMKTTLEGIKSYDELENLPLNLAYFLNSNHTALQNGKGLPMTGIVETTKVYATVTEAEADCAKIELERAVARVELYIRKENGVTINLTSGTTITLENSYSREYFIRHDTPPFGRIQTVTSGLFPQTWTLTGAIPDSNIPDSGDGLLLCSFYTPERTCTALNNTDKLVLTLELVASDGSRREGEVIFDRFYKQGILTPIERIERNNNYRIMATIENRVIAAKIVILPWHVVEIPTDFN